MVLYTLLFVIRSRKVNVHNMMKQYIEELKLYP